MRLRLVWGVVFGQLCGCGVFAPGDDALSRERPLVDAAAQAGDAASAEAGDAAPAEGSDAAPSGDWIDEPPGPIAAPDLVVDGGIVLDRTTGLEWQRVHSAAVALGGQLDVACKDLVIDGKGGFRLPTRSELLSIVDLGRINPAYPEVFPRHRDTEEFFWSATPTIDGVGRWAVASWDGVAVRCGERLSPVRCVRGGRPASGPRFVVEGERVLDLRTGIRWRRVVEAELLDYVLAAGRCAARGERLPSAHELQSIVDTRRRSPAIDPIFGETPRETFWSSSTHATLHYYAWAVSFETGETVYANPDTQLRVRCVR